MTGKIRGKDLVVGLATLVLAAIGAGSLFLGPSIAQICGPGGYGYGGYSCTQPYTISLSPKSATNAVSSEHCVEATVRDSTGAEASGVDVRFTVVGTADGEVLTTGSNGRSRFCYAGPASPRQDTITATIETGGGSGPYFVNPTSCPSEGLSYRLSFTYENLATIRVSPTIACSELEAIDSVTDGESGHTQQVTVSQSSTTGPTSVRISTSLSTDGGGKPSATTNLNLTVPDGMVRNFGDFPSCTREALEQHGPAGCPADAKVGEGNAVFNGSPVIDTYVADVTVLDGTGGQLFLYFLPDIGPPVVAEGDEIEGALRFVVPPFPTLPEYFASLVALDVIIDAPGAGPPVTDSAINTWAAGTGPGISIEPASGPNLDGSRTFTFFSPSDPTATFECSVDGSAAIPCASPYKVSAMPVGAHTFRVRAVDSAGTRGPFATASFEGTVASVNPSSSGPSGGSPVSAAQALPPPKVGQTANVQLVSGVVRIRLPGSSKYILLTDAQQIPMGSTIDATKGKVRITTAAKGGGTQTAVFYDGVFLITQKQNGLTDLRLVNGKGTACLARNVKRSVISKKRKKSGQGAKVRKLWGDGSGKFRTTGHYSSATVRGTIWLVEDHCNGTLTKVRKGKVSVRDFVRKRTILVKAPKSYFAKRTR